MASSFYLLPNWFFGYDVVLELLFGVVTALVAFFAMKVYSLSQERDFKILGFAFISISISYFLLAILNLLAASSQIRSEIITITLRDISVPSSMWIYGYVFFFILGLSMLTYLTFNVRNQRLFALIASMSFIVILFSKNAGIAFNFVAAVLLFYVFLYHFDKFLDSKARKVSFVMVAFLLLFLARISFAFSYFNPFPYVVDHFIELIAYFLIIISLFRVVRK